MVRYDPNGPAGVLVGVGEGRVFGREVEGVVREGWGLVASGSGKGKKGGEGGEGEGEVVLVVGGRGREVLPALVVRCVDYCKSLVHQKRERERERESGSEKREMRAES